MEDNYFLTDGMLNNYISKLDYKPLWTNIVSERPRPGMRGGHQMFLDTYTDTIYLFGGWDGHHDLSDLWAYHIPRNIWTLISPDTSAEVSVVFLVKVKVIYFLHKEKNPLWLPLSTILLIKPE